MTQNATQGGTDSSYHLSTFIRELAGRVCDIQSEYVDKYGVINWGELPFHKVVATLRKAAQASETGGFGVELKQLLEKSSIYAHQCKNSLTGTFREDFNRLVLREIEVLRMVL